MREKDLEILAVTLPEDIVKAKWCGDFEFAQKLISNRLENPRTPEFMKQRLRAEAEILERLPLDYGLTVEEGLLLVQQSIPDFTMEELMALIESGMADWIYVRGEIHLANRFFATLRDNYPTFAARAGDIRESFDEGADYQIKNEISDYLYREGRAVRHITLTITRQIRDEAFKPGKVLVHLPIPKHQINISNIQILKTFPANGERGAQVRIGGETDPQRTVSFSEDMRENHPFSVTFSYDCTALCRIDEEGQVRQELQWETEEPVRASDLQEQYPHIRFTDTLRALQAEIISQLQPGSGAEPEANSGAEPEASSGAEPEVNSEAEPEATADPTPGCRDAYLASPEGKLALARAFYDFVTTKVVYSYMRSYFTLEEIPEYAAVNLKGDCGVQALLFITLCRMSGIPARWQSGMYVTPARGDKPAETGSHDWAMFHIEPYGWFFADPSFGGGAYRSGNLRRWHYYFGNLDPYRMAANDAFQAPLTPEKRHTRQDPYDNQSGEMEYEDQGLVRGESTYHTEVEMA